MINPPRRRAVAGVQRWPADYRRQRGDVVDPAGCRPRRRGGWPRVGEHLQVVAAARLVPGVLIGGRSALDLAQIQGVVDPDQPGTASGGSVRPISVSTGTCSSSASVSKSIGDGDQIAGIEQLVVLEPLGALQASDPVGEAGEDGSIVMAVEEIAELGVGGDLADAEGGGEVVGLQLVLEAALELEQGGILDVEQSESRSSRAGRSGLCPVGVRRGYRLRSGNGVDEGAETKYRRASPSPLAM